MNSYVLQISKNLLPRSNKSSLQSLFLVMRSSSTFQIGFLSVSLYTLAVCQDQPLVARTSNCSRFDTLSSMVSDLQQSPFTDWGVTDCSSSTAWDCLSSDDLPKDLYYWTELMEKCDNMCLIPLTVDLLDPDIMGKGYVRTA
jgi:hypothetical protein